MITINIYIKGINKNKENIENIIECENQKNVKNIIKWIILSGYSFMFSAVYFSAKISIFYLNGRIITLIFIILIILFSLYLFIFLYIYSLIHLKISEIINKKNLGNILSNILAAYALLSLAIYLIAEKLILVIAIVYTALPIILPLIAVKYINKNDNHDKNNSIPEK
jgi:fatty acid desaturase